MRALLADDSLRRVWAIGGVAGLMRWLDQLVVGVYVFDVTHSPLLVALVTLARLMPMLAGAFVGAFVERLALRRVLGYGLAAIAGVYAVLAVLAFTGLLQIWHVGLGALLIGLYWSSEMSVRRTMLGEIAGPERMGKAMGLDWATINSTRLIGPLLGGALYTAFGVGGAYAAGVICFGISAALAYGLTAGAVPRGASGRRVLSDIADGFRQARARPIVMGTLAATVVMNCFTFPYATMVPVIGHDILHASPVAVGMLTSAEGIGALIGSLALSGLARIKWYGRVFLIGSVISMIGAIGFGLSTSYALSIAILIVLGAGSAAFATMQSTLILTYAPPDQRSRMMGVLSSAIGAGQIGYLYIGVMADWIGAPLAVVFSMVQGLLLLALCVMAWPALWKGES
jgi:MFS family permease